MFEEEKFQICVGEMFRDEDGSQWYHCFLVLAANCPEEEVAQHVINQIHFDQNDFGKIVPIPLTEMKEKHKAQSAFKTLIVGGDEHIFALWNHMARFADGLAETAINFGPNSLYEPTSINCRTGVRETLKAGNLVLYPEFTKCSAGMEAPSFFLGKRFDHYAPRP